MLKETSNTNTTYANRMNEHKPALVKFLWLPLPGFYEKNHTGRSLPKKWHRNAHFIMLRFAAEWLNKVNIENVCLENVYLLTYLLAHLLT